MDLLSRAVEAAENPENEINFMFQNAKESLADLLEYYAKQARGEDTLKKPLTHPPLFDLAKETLEAVVAGD